MMKRILTLSMLFLAFVGFAQPEDDELTRKEKLKAHKIAFISTELDLSPEEAEKFWPVYNELEAEMETIHKEKRKLMKSMKEMGELSEKEAYDNMERIFELEAQENQLRTEYLGKFADVLGKKKAVKVFIAEEKFKRELLKKLKERPGKGGGRGGGGNKPGGRGGPNGGPEFER